MLVSATLGGGFASLLRVVPNVFLTSPTSQKSRTHGVSHPSMNKHRFVVAALLAIAACGAETARPVASARTCAVVDSTRLSGYGFGALRVSATVDEVRAACDLVADTTLEHGNEGLPERRLAVLVGSDTVEATVVSDSIFRLELTTARIRTVDSLGVGTTAAVLRAKGATLAVGDRGVFALVPSHCGLSFQLSVNPASGEWSQIADSASVRRVLVFGCEGGPG